MTLGLALVSVGMAAAPASAATHELGALHAPAAKSPSDWLREGEALELRGEHVEAAAAYEEALTGLSARVQRGNEGARAAMLAADAHWRAFDLDADPVHLAAGLDVLGRWLAMTDSQSEASELGNVQRRVGRLRAVHEPLVAGDAALAAGRTAEASRHYDEALEALSHDPLDWDTGAKLALRIADDLVQRYDASVRSPSDIDHHLGELQLARDVLEKWHALPPPQGAARSAALEQWLAEARARLIEAEEALAEVVSIDSTPTVATTVTPAVPMRPAAREGTGLIIAAGITGGLAWVNAFVRLGVCQGELDCEVTTAGVGMALNTPGHFLGPFAGAHRGRYHGIAGAWDGAPQRRPELFKGLGAGMLGVGVTGRIATFVLSFLFIESGTQRGYVAVHPILAQLSSSAIGGGGALLAYGVTYQRTRDTEERRRRAAGLSEALPSPPQRGRYTGLTLLGGGLVATGAGAAMMARGIVLDDEADGAMYKALSLEARYLDAYDKGAFDAELRASRPGITSMIVGGNVLVVGGILASSVGIALLAHDVRSRRLQRQARVRLSSQITPTLLMLSLAGGF